MKKVAGSNKNFPEKKSPIRRKVSDALTDERVRKEKLQNGAKDFAIRFEDVMRELANG